MIYKIDDDVYLPGPKLDLRDVLKNHPMVAADLRWLVGQAYSNLTQPAHRVIARDLYYRLGGGSLHEYIKNQSSD